MLECRLEFKGISQPALAHRTILYSFLNNGKDQETYAIHLQE